MEFSKFTIICGHYGCGKTNLTLNIAADIRSRGEKVCIVDLDVVNPYFRSSDYNSFLESINVRLIAPKYARSSVDAPALPAEINAVFEYDGYVLIDAGGDDVGATALGRYSSKIKEREYEMLYVINRYRPLTSESGDAAALLREIEHSSRLYATSVINNSHLMSETDALTVLESLEYAKNTAAKLGLPLKFTAIPRALTSLPAHEKEPYYPVDIHVRTPWNQITEERKTI